MTNKSLTTGGTRNEALQASKSAHNLFAAVLAMPNDRCREMQRRMAMRVGNFKIVQTVVVAHVIAVMNYFLGCQVATDCLFNNKPVLQDVSGSACGRMAVALHANVAVTSDETSSFRHRDVVSGFNRAELRAVLTSLIDFVLVCVKRRTASGTRHRPGLRRILARERAVLAIAARDARRRESHRSAAVHAVHVNRHPSILSHGMVL